MVLRFATLLLAAMLVLAPASAAQTAAELVQKAVYTQQTAGDPDAAIQMYRQAIGAAGADRALAARAQMQLVSAFLQKGDFTGASREFSTLVFNYADQKDVIAAMTGAVQAAGNVRSHSTPKHVPGSGGATIPHSTTR